MNTSITRLRLAMFALVLVSSSVTAEPLSRETTWQGVIRSYVVLVPEDLEAGDARPLLVLLHGSGRRGQTMIEPWGELAKEERIVLVAPNSLDPKLWQGPHDGPGFLEKVIGEVSKIAPVDSRRIYVFGHSGGAKFALFMGMMESEYFAAIAVHAGAIPSAHEAFIDVPTRRIPVGMWSGDRDKAVPAEDVRRTAALLGAKGFPVQLAIIPGHDHDYRRVSGKINREAWAFLSSHAMAQAPHYIDRGDRDEPR